MNAKEKISVSKTCLVLDQPFFGALLMRLKMVEDPSCKTMWTDSKSIGYNPAFVDELSVHEVQGVLCHEVLHVANGHCWRRGARDHKRWNEACDYAINPIVIEARMLLPKGGLLNDQYKGMSCEQVYSSLLEDNQDAGKQQQPKQQGGGDGNGPFQPQSGQPGDSENESSENESEDGAGEEDFGLGEVRDTPDPDTQSEMESEWKIAVSQAAMAAKMQGKLPGSLRRLVEDMLHVKVDWRSVLHRFVQQTAQNDYSWKRPNSRYMHMGMYLPSLYSEEMGPLVVAIDTSGSIDDVLLSQFASEINGIVSEMQPESVHVIYVDTKVHRADEFMRGEQVVMNAAGGGGTDFCPAFDWVEKGAVNPVCMIYFTDLMGSFPSQVPDYPVLWATTEKSVAPFGETVFIEH